MPRTKKAKETAENKAPEIDYSPVFDIQVPRPETFNFGPATNPIPVTTVPVLTASQWVMMAREIAGLGHSKGRERLIGLFSGAACCSKEICCY